MEDVTEAMINCDSLKRNQQSLILKHSPQLSKPLSTTVLQKQIYLFYSYQYFYLNISEILKPYSYLRNLRLLS